MGNVKHPSEPSTSSADPRPAIDLQVPDQVQTATFALG